MDKDTLVVAERYFEVGQYQKAYDQLTSMTLNIERSDQIDHHHLLADILNKVGRQDEALKLVNDLRTKFPDDYSCLTNWISCISGRPAYAVEGYELAQSMRTDYPHDYWLPFIMAYIAYEFRLKTSAEIQALVEESLRLSRASQVLRLAYRVYINAGRDEDAKACLDEIVKESPEDLDTYLLLLDYLKRSKRYIEQGQVSYEALKKYPANSDLKDYLDYANNHLYGRYIGKISNLAENVGDKIRIERSSTKAWMRYAIITMMYLAFSFTVVVLLTGIFLYICGFLFLFHYVVMSSDEREIKRLKKSKLAKTEFGYVDQLNDINTSATILVASTRASNRFMYIGEEGVILAKDAHCIIEDLHFELKTEDLIDFKAIAYHEIDSIEVSAKYLSVKTKKDKHHEMYFESTDSLAFALEQLEIRGYHLTKHKKASRILLLIGCFFGAKACLTASVFALILSWLLGMVLIVMTLTNFANILIYRLMYPLETDVYKKGSSND